GKTLWVLATEQRIPLQGELRADNPQVNIGAYRAVPRADQLDLLAERATRHDPAGRPTMAEFSAELRAWLAAPQEAEPTDLTDVLARLRALTPPGMRTEADRARLLASAGRLHGELEAGMRAVASQLKTTGLSDGSLFSTMPDDGLLG